MNSEKVKKEIRDILMAVTRESSFSELVDKLTEIVEREAKRAADDAAFDVLRDYIGPIGGISD